MAITGFGSVYTLAFVIFIGLVIHAWRRRRRGGLPLPPGPSGLPLVGNVFDLISTHPWLSYEEWGKKYGDVVYVNMLGMDFIIINSAKVAHELMDRRSAVYSERPYIRANELFGMDFNSGLLPYGHKWRLHRKLFNFALNKETACQYKPVAINKARQFAGNLLDSPLQYCQHCKTFATATSMAALYDYDVAPKNDPFVAKLDYFIRLFSTALTPEKAALLLAFPFLAYIPPWLPGGTFKKKAVECRSVAKEVLAGPVGFVIEHMALGTAKESFVRQLLESDRAGADQDTIKAVATSAFLGGTDTSDSTMRVFILAMVLNPEIQTKAREEIDRVVGADRLPDFDDRTNLPYIEAICLETYRWLPVIPCALPHMTASSDVYEGMYIPKGAIVLTNIWAMGHDESRFDDPLAFKPERHLALDGTVAQGTVNNSFGFGRRACPGRYFADQNVWAAIVTLLATVRFGKAHDEFGNEIEVNVELTSGIATCPKPFACSITPRSSYARNLIRQRNENGR